MRIIESDLQQIADRALADLLRLKNAHIFLTGGTGYVGRWLLEGLSYANVVLGLGIKVTVLSRNPGNFVELYPHFGANPMVSWVTGDVRTFRFPEHDYSHIIHAATDVVELNSEIDTFDVIVSGTKRVLEFARLNSIPQVLLLSSGAVYGAIPATIHRVSENYTGAPLATDPKSAYGLGKLAAEWLGAAYSEDGRIACKTARLFTQVGPYLALDKRFVAGNFIQNALNKEPFLIKSDGTALRSYMYGSDLVVWLLRILCQGKVAYPYNVGSDDPVSITELANLTAKAAEISDPIITILGQPSSSRPQDCYIPDISRARNELGLEIVVKVEEAMAKTLGWFRHAQ
jgi:nucleoside-diphosphate-sugar epimerase